MTEAQKVRARALKAMGHSDSAIARELGVWQRTVWRLFNRERCNEYHREWKRRNYGSTRSA